MRALLATLVLAVAAQGCVTPSIPIPPPDPSKMEFTVTVNGTASTTVMSYPETSYYRGGIAYLYNRFQHAGVIQDVNANGSIGPTPPMAAALGDEIVVTVQLDTQSESSCIVLRNGVQDPTTYCGP